MYVNGSHRIKLVKLFPPVPWKVSQFVRTVKAKDYFELVNCLMAYCILIIMFYLNLIMELCERSKCKFDNVENVQNKVIFYLQENSNCISGN